MKRQKTKTARAPMARWQRILFIPTALALVWFFCPVFAGILNPANLAAMAGLGLVLWALTHWERFTGLLRRLWKKPWGKLLLLVSGVGTAALLLVLLVLSILVISQMGARPREPSESLIVLGCQVRGDDPSLLLYYRIQAAGDYLQAHPEASAVLSGGQGPGENISEAECMYRALTARGIDPARLYREDASHITRENLEFSAEILRDRGLSGPVIIVSNDFHLYRALRMARDQGLEAQGLAARSNWYSKPTYILREAMALIKYWLTK